MFKHYVSNIYNEIITKSQWENKYKPIAMKTFDPDAYKESFPKLKALFTKLNGGKFSPVVILDFDNSLASKNEMSNYDLEMIKLLKKLGYKVTNKSYLLGIVLKGDKEIPIKKIMDSFKSKKLDQMKEVYEKTKNIEIKKQIDFIEGLQSKNINEKILTFFGEKGRYKLVFSMNFRHIASQSTEVGWHSCMNLDDGTRNNYVGSGISGGAFIVWLAKVGDELALSGPTARVLCKPFVGEMSNNIIWIVDKVYEDAPAGFRKAVEKILEKYQKKIPDDYLLKRGVYADTLSHKENIEPKGEVGDKVDFLLTVNFEKENNETKYAKIAREYWDSLSENMKKYVIFKRPRLINDFLGLDEVEKKKYILIAAKRSVDIAENFLSDAIKNNKEITEKQMFYLGKIDKNTWKDLVLQGLKISEKAYEKLFTVMDKAEDNILRHFLLNLNNEKIKSVMSKNIKAVRKGLLDHTENFNLYRNFKNDLPNLIDEDTLKAGLIKDLGIVIEVIPSEMISDEVLNEAFNSSLKTKGLTFRFIVSFLNEENRKIKFEKDALITAFQKCPSNLSAMYDHPEDMDKVGLKIDDDLCEAAVSRIGNEKESGIRDKIFEIAFEHFKNQGKEKEFMDSCIKYVWRSIEIVNSMRHISRKYGFKMTDDYIQRLVNENSKTVKFGTFSKKIREQYINSQDPNNPSSDTVRMIGRDIENCFNDLPNEWLLSKNLINELIKRGFDVDEGMVHLTQEKRKVFVHEFVDYFKSRAPYDAQVLSVMMNVGVQFSDKELAEIFKKSIDEVKAGNIPTSNIKILVEMFKDTETKFDLDENTIEDIMNFTGNIKVFEIITPKSIPENLALKVLDQLLAKKEGGHIVNFLSRLPKITDLIIDKMVKGNYATVLVSKLSKMITIDQFIEVFEKMKKYIFDMFETCVTLIDDPLANYEYLFDEKFVNSMGKMGVELEDMATVFADTIISTGFAAKSKQNERRSEKVSKAYETIKVDDNVSEKDLQKKLKRLYEDKKFDILKKFVKIIKEGE